MNRYQKFALCICLVAGLLLLMWLFAAGLSPAKAQEETGLSAPTPKAPTTIPIETHAPREN